MMQVTLLFNLYEGRISSSWRLYNWRKDCNEVKFEDVTAIKAKTHDEVQDMVNRLVGTGRKYNMEINIDKS